MLRGEFGYGEEISLQAEGGKLLYDIDFDDLLDRPLKDLGLHEGRTLIVVDEDTDRVNVEFLISEGEELVIPVLGDIPSKPTEVKAKENGVENGVDENGTGKKRQREDDEDIEFRKKARVAVEGDAANDVIIIDEDEDMVMID
jgi:ubiquitin-like 1-activating enzyme E1 B